MPKEKKKRGRRAEEARRKKAQQEGIENAHTEDVDYGYSEDAAYDPSGAAEVSTFFGLLDEEEQEYFKNVGTMLQTDPFEAEEDRNIYLTNVYKEADDKILKLVSSQSCSRVVERMITFSNESQLKSLFQKCSGNFLQLIQHRFASHFCESLFAKAAKFVSKEQEVGGAVGDWDGDVKMDLGDEEVFASMESLYLFTLNELESSIQGLLTHPFASHTIRVLLMVLSGKGTQDTASTNLIAGRGKENQIEPDQLAQDRKVPDSFLEATSRIIGGLGEKISIRELRILATHKIGNPTLQLVLRIELADARKRGKKDKKTPQKNTLLGKLLSSDEGEEEGIAGSFLQNLFYDSVGSHLLETIVQFSSEKTFGELYERYFKERIGALARNDTASFVAVRIVDRLEGEQLKGAVESVVPLVPNLLDRSLVGVLRALIEDCKKQSVDASKLVKAIQDHYRDDPTTLILHFLKLTLDDLQPPDSTASSRPSKATSSQLHHSLLAQCLLLHLSSDLTSFLNNGLLSQPPTSLLHLSLHPTASRVIQASLTSPHSTPLHKRKLLNNLLGNFPQLALNPCGSHLVDACWDATRGMNKYRQLIAEELVPKERELRESLPGSMVWRNWKLDKYKTRRGEWFKLDQLQEEKDPAMKQDVPGTNKNGNDTAGEVKKTPIQLARERRAAERKKREELAAKRARREGNVNINKSTTTTTQTPNNQPTPRPTSISTQTQNPVPAPPPYKKFAALASESSKKRGPEDGSFGKKKTKQKRLF